MSKKDVLRRFRWVKTKYLWQSKETKQNWTKLENVDIYVYA